MRFRIILHKEYRDFAYISICSSFLPIVSLINTILTIDDPYVPDDHFNYSLISQFCFVSITFSDEF